MSRGIKSGAGQAGAQRLNPRCGPWRDMRLSTFRGFPAPPRRAHSRTRRRDRNVKRRVDINLRTKQLTYVRTCGDIRAMQQM
jgi:hypothetical protein